MLAHFTSKVTRLRDSAVSGPSKSGTKKSQKMGKPCVGQIFHKKQQNKFSYKFSNFAVKGCPFFLRVGR